MCLDSITSESPEKTVMDAWGLFWEAFPGWGTPSDLLQSAFMGASIKPGIWMHAENFTVHLRGQEETYITGFHKFTRLQDTISCLIALIQSGEHYEPLAIRRVKLKEVRLLGTWNGYETAVADRMLVIPIKGDTLYVDEEPSEEIKALNPR